MDYQEAVKILNSVPEISVDGRSMSIYVPSTFVYETYTDKIKEALSILMHKYKFTLQ
jgi:hypothetical protein